MQIIFTFSVSALLLASEAVAAATTKSLVTCITKNGPKPVATVKTVSRVLTVPFYGFKFTTTTPTRVITPSPTTITITATATSVTTETLTQETDTFSETVTYTDTITTTSTELSTVTNSDTVTVTLSPTTTLAAPAGFQPVRSTFPNSAKRRSASQPEDTSSESALKERSQAQARILFKNGKAECSPEVYPTAVTCAGIAKVISTSTITQTAKTKTVTATKPTSSVTTTTTSVITTTLTPVRASTTLSFTTSVSITQTQVHSSTTTVLSTQTVEVVEPTSTYYASCSPDNVINQVNGQSINGVALNGLTPQSSKALSPYECCTRCIDTSGCRGTVYVNASNQCLMLIQSSGICSPDSPGGRVISNVGTGVVFSISNGPCGRYQV